jgi:hypothetical protein
VGLREIKYEATVERQVGRDGREESSCLVVGSREDWKGVKSHQVEASVQPGRSGVIEHPGREVGDLWEQQDDGAAEPPRPIKPTIGPRRKGKGSCPRK